MSNHVENWNRLGVPQPRALVDARLQLHYAAQVVSAVGRKFLPKQEDDSHTNLGWMVELGALTSRMAGDEQPFRAALEFDEFRLVLLDEENHYLSTQPLDGMTMDDAYAWLASAIAERTGSAVKQDLSALHYELPSDGLAQGGTFMRGHISGVRELGRWFANAELLFQKFRRQGGAEAEIRCWPHHFDLAGSLALGGGKSIGVGLSPGDASYAEPYLYVSPWPYPKRKTWPELTTGAWHTEGFVAAVLTGTELVGISDQSGVAAKFLSAAVAASRKLLV